MYHVPWIALISAKRWRLDVLTFLIHGFGSFQSCFFPISRTAFFRPLHCVCKGIFGSQENHSLPSLTTLTAHANNAAFCPFFCSKLFRVLDFISFIWHFGGRWYSNRTCLRPIILFGPKEKILLVNKIIIFCP